LLLVLDAFGNTFNLRLARKIDDRQHDRRVIGGARHVRGNERSSIFIASIGKRFR